MRLFLSIDIDRSVLLKVEEIQKEIKQKVGFNWVPPENFHITLKFLDAFKKDQVEGLKILLGSIKLPSFKLSLEKLELFPTVSEPKVFIYSLGGDSERLEELHELIEKSCRTLGFAREKRKFHPHLTLARVKKLSEVKKVFSYLNKKCGLEFNVNSFCLMHSTLTPEGAQYSLIKEFKLHE
ncbi:MAG: RNA 2',3'-cyclic phosphodiesterase [Deltaproteobacteria bacterium]|nr:RNA 2',3'-cyclic phosphodiesterase [Deltaproteobacteria bacterium]